MKVWGEESQQKRSRAPDMPEGGYHQGGSAVTLEINSGNKIKTLGAMWLQHGGRREPGVDYEGSVWSTKPNAGKTHLSDGKPVVGIFSPGGVTIKRGQRMQTHPVSGKGNYTLTKTPVDHTEESKCVSFIKHAKEVEHSVENREVTPKIGGYSLVSPLQMTWS